MELDHLAVAGATLEDAAAHLEAALGVPLQPGGVHARFGTHNRLLGLSGGLYLEAIAVDPAASDPGRPRWFDLDRLTGPAHLRAWVARVPDLDAALADAPAGSGAPVELARGDLRWRMAVPEDGVLPFDGVFPALIEWRGDLHPAGMLPASGCALSRLILSHPEAAALSRALGSVPRVVVEPGPPGLRAEIDTPHGPRHLA